MNKEEKNKLLELIEDIGLALDRVYCPMEDARDMLARVRADSKAKTMYAGYLANGSWFQFDDTIMDSLKAGPFTPKDQGDESPQGDDLPKAEDKAPRHPSVGPFFTLAELGLLGRTDSPFCANCLSSIPEDGLVALSWNDNDGRRISLVHPHCKASEQA